MVRLFSLFVAVSCALLSPNPVCAADEAPAPSPPSQHILIWSGARDRAGAERQLKDFGEVATALADRLEVEARVVESARVDGLKPGFFVVALGLCPAKEKDGALAPFRALRPPVYEKPVRFDPARAGVELGCPGPVEVTTDSAGDPVVWDLDRVAAIDPTPKTRLVGLQFSYEWSEEGDFARSYHEVAAHFLLLDAGGRLLDASTVAVPGNAATAKRLEAKGQQLELEVEYADPPCDPSGDQFVLYAKRATVRAKKGQIQIAEPEARELRSGTCGYAEEDRMIQGLDHQH